MDNNNTELPLFMHRVIREIVYNNQGDIYNFIQHNREKVSIYQGDFQIHSSEHGKIALFLRNFLQNQGEVAALETSCTLIDCTI